MTFLESDATVLVTGGTGSFGDSVRLVEQAFTRALPGDVFIHKARSCRVGNLALAMCQLALREPGLVL
ncbi:hypothetical protein [Micromonospora sp. LOL_024]|uniref:hypothetical protein n=1 Tax=Micromonospora sp. LOL_024 TaxID=3345412 RepID=UPI003A842FEE